ncbi:hypothetical protein ACP4OV_008458 [Aristida adscensionis]
MEGQTAVNLAISAVAGELAGRAVSGLIGMFRKQETTDEKLQRLEMLVHRIRSAVKTSEKHDVKNDSLLQWRDKLKEAATEGEQVLAVFRQRATDARALPLQQQGGASSSSSSGTPPVPSALAFTMNALRGMATKTLFQSDEDTLKLNAAVEKLEKQSPHVWEFIELLQLEILPKMANRRPNKRKRPQVLTTHSIGSPVIHISSSGGELVNMGQMGMEAKWRKIHCQIPDIATHTSEYNEYQLWFALWRRLMLSMNRIGWAVKMAADRDMDDLGIVQWAAVLKKAFQRGKVLHSSIYHYIVRCYRYNDQAAQFPHGMDEVDGLMCSLEILARDVEYFGSLLVLCPWDPRLHFGSHLPPSESLVRDGSMKERTRSHPSLIPNFDCSRHKRASSPFKVITKVKAEQTGSCATSAMDGNNQAAAHKKLQQLELVLLKIHSTVEVSERHIIERGTPLQWWERLKEAASHGDEVLLRFQQQGQGLSVNEAAADQNGDGLQASAATSATALSFTRNTLSGMLWCIHTTPNALSLSTMDMKKLDSALEMLDKEFQNVKKFPVFFQLEISRNLRQKPIIHISSGRFGSSPIVLAPAEPLHIKTCTSLPYTPPDDRELPDMTLLVGRLQEALGKINMAVKMVKIRDINGMEWLAQWADLLQVVRQQGRTVLGVIRTKASKETADYDLEEDKLRSFVHTIETLAGDLEDFNWLASFCPPM